MKVQVSTLDIVPASLEKWQLDFLGGTVDKNLPANARDMGLIPCLERFRVLWRNEAPEPQLLSPCA